MLEPGIFRGLASGMFGLIKVQEVCLSGWLPVLLDLARGMRLGYNTNGNSQMACLSS